jgi:hypothetical protein
VICILLLKMLGTLVSHLLLSMYRTFTMTMILVDFKLRTMLLSVIIDFASLGYTCTLFLFKSVELHRLQFTKCVHSAYDGYADQNLCILCAWEWSIITLPKKCMENSV